MKLGVDSVPLEHIREALAFAVANGWRPPTENPDPAVHERPTMRCLPAAKRALRAESRRA